MIKEDVSSPIYRVVPLALLAFSFLCALVPVLTLLLTHSSWMLASRSHAAPVVIAVTAAFALCLALAAAVVFRRFASKPTRSRLEALESTCRTLRSSAEQKDLLLREVHHRVKNDLQILTSTLSLSDSRSLSAEGRELLVDSRNRIHAISLIHELLYRSADLQGISIRGYVSELVRRIERSLLPSGDTVSIVSRIGDFYFDTDTSVACGLLVNELVTNSLKYAFPNGDGGVILIRVERADEPGSYLLQVQDDGVGIPNDCLISNSGSLGMRLVRALTEQLRGTYAVESEDGTTWRIRFHAEELAATPSDIRDRG